MPITDRTEPALDNLFTALDGRAVVVGDRTWRLHLYSVRELDKTVWIQLDVVGSPTYVLTLCQPLTTDSTEVLATVSRYLELTKDAADSVVFDRILGSALMPVTVQGAAQVAAE